MTDPWSYDQNDPRQRTTPGRPGVPWGPVAQPVQGSSNATGPVAPPPYPQVPYATPPGWTPAPTDISQYAAPRTRVSTIVLIVAGIALLGLIFATVFLKPAATPTATPTVSVSASGMPFTVPTDPNSTGHWEVLDREWSSVGVSVHVHITVESGTVNYAFQAYGNGETDATAPTRGGRQPELTTGSLTSGDVADGYVFLKLPHQDATLFLTTRGGKAISALPVTA
jgi:hypothetical protein